MSNTPRSQATQQQRVQMCVEWFCVSQCEVKATPRSLKPVLNWANVCSPEHTSDTSTNYDSFLNWTFSSPNMVRTFQTLLHSQLACNEMQASARTCGRRAADSMIENVGSSQVKSSQYTSANPHRVIQLTTISFWVFETRLRLPQVNK